MSAPERLSVLLDEHASLERELADPSVHADQTRARRLSRRYAALEPQQALELLLDKLKKTRNNVEFLMQIQKTTLGPGND